MPIFCDACGGWKGDDVADDDAVCVCNVEPIVIIEPKNAGNESKDILKDEIGKKSI